MPAFKINLVSYITFCMGLYGAAMPAIGKTFVSCELSSYDDEAHLEIHPETSAMTANDP